LVHSLRLVVALVVEVQPQVLVRGFLVGQVAVAHGERQVLSLPLVTWVIMEETVL